MKVEKLWGSRFDSMPSQEIIDFLSGRDVKALPPSDEQLIPYDLWCNRAHVLMLCKQGLLTRQDGKRILKGLRKIEGAYQKGQFTLDPSKEDVHSNLESELIRLIGVESGGKLHTGRSRNDQIAVDMRLYLRDQVLDFVERMIRLIDVLLQRASLYRFTVMPGYTHHQHAVHTTFGHLLLSFAEALDRDIQRVTHWMLFFNRNPLGSAAGYGTTFPLDRILTSELLGFDGPTENVTDPITQRWEAEAELAYAVSVLMNHLSTMAQTFILLSTQAFDMIRMADAHCSGSSMMPQKRNPDVLEVIKAKASYAHGMLVSLLSAGKGLFVGYNRDTQWTKYWIMDLIDETRPAVSLMAEVVRLLDVKEEKMAEQAERGFIGATALMEWLIQSFGLPLRKAKILVEKAVKYSEKEGLERVSHVSLTKALGEMQIKINLRPEEVNRVQQPRFILSRMHSLGGPSKKGIERNMASLRKRLQTSERWLSVKRKKLEKSKAVLSRMEKEL